MSKKSTVLLIAFFFVVLGVAWFAKPESFQSKFPRAGVLLDKGDHFPGHYGIDGPNQDRLLAFLRSEGFAEKSVIHGGDTVEIDYEREYPFIFFWRHKQRVEVISGMFNGVAFIPDVYPEGR